MFERFLQILFVIVAVAIFSGGVFIMLTMDAASRSAGGRFYVAVAVLVLLGAVDTQVGRLVRRRTPLSLIESAEYRRYRIRSVLLMGLSALVLVVFALLCPY